MPCAPETWVKQCCDRYGTEIIVVGLGEKGALLWVKRDNFLERFPAAQIRPVVNTIGAGDALFACFLHAYQRSGDPYEAIQKAILFAAYKIGETRAAEGFLTPEALEALVLNLTSFKLNQPRPLRTE
ncbi:carbohydrate kinase family protein [Oscillatoria sp. FACHB-1406]|uniref:carbohydrate kinase family protein n=1 Tax=Oscillatoria sp. FACHB-1406 TaxID=2692846 RepID=UPI0018F022F0|nr:carbohydrate kinase family protein [Oscillatoria sp. FACHB-1406]